MYHFEKSVPLKDIRIQTYGCFAAKDIYEAYQDPEILLEMNQEPFFYLNTFYQALTQYVRGEENSYTAKPLSTDQSYRRVEMDGKEDTHNWHKDDEAGDYKIESSSHLIWVFKTLLNILAEEYPPFLTIEEDSTIMLSQYDGEEEKICFNLYGLIDDDLDRRELCRFTPYLYNDAIPTLTICSNCGIEWDGFAQCWCHWIEFKNEDTEMDEEEEEEMMQDWDIMIDR